MVTPDVEDRRRRLTIRFARSLPCNPPEVVRVMTEVATKVIDNILSDPEKVAFRDLREANKSVQTKLLAPHGGRELMHLLGFEKISQHGENVYFMSEVDPNYLTEARGWLHMQATAAMGMPKAQEPGATVCADCIIQIKLTSGQTLEGGFFKSETVKDIYDFVRASVVNSEEELLLRTVGHGSLTRDKQGLTLERADLYPRAILSVVKTSIDTVALSDEEIMEQARRKAKQEERDAAAQLRKIKEAHLKSNEAKEAEKALIVARFKEDRDKQHGLHSMAVDDGGVEEHKAGGH